MTWLLLQNSLVLAASVTCLATVLGFTAALCAAGLERRWRNALLACAVVALLMPPFLVTNCWLHYFGVIGVWRSWFPLNIYSFYGAIGILTMLSWPIPMLACLAAWPRVEAAQLEADPLLRGVWLVRLLLWPVARPAIGLAVLVVFVLALNNFAVPTILQIRVLPAHLWVTYTTNLDAGGALLAALPLIFPPLAILISALRTGIPWPFRDKPAEAALYRRQLGGQLLFVARAATIALIITSVAWPIGHLVGAAETWKQLPLVLKAASGAITNSVFYAAATASMCLLAGLALWPIRVASCLWLLFLIPGLFIAIALIGIFNRPWLGILYGTSAMVVLACTLRYCALAWGSLRGALQNVDRELTDAARVEGARGWALFWHVHRPQVAPYAAFAWYIIYLLCLWDVETLVLLLPPGGETIAVRVFNMLHYGHIGQVNALCLVLLAVALVPLVFVFRPHKTRVSTHEASGLTRGA